MKKNRKNLLKEVIQYVIILIVVIIIRTFIFTPIRVQQKSMYPTLNPNDIMILNKIGLYTSNIKRFDIVVIKLDDEYIIKRVIGLPNESIEYKDDMLYVNDEEIKETFIDANTEDFKLEDIGYVTIPKNKYFVLGDNRGNSTDSRVLGLIDRKDILGKTNFVLFPFKYF